MKNLKKTLAIVTAIAAMFVSVSVFAQTDLTECDTGISGSCTGEDGANPVVTATVSSSIVDGGEMAFLVLNKDVNPLTTDVAADDILYIDQHPSSEGASFTGPINLDRVGDDLTALPEGTYFVRIGYNSKTTGNFAIANAKLVIESAGPSGTTVTFRWGDVTLDSYVNGSDALSILNYVADIIESYPVADTEDFTEGQLTVGSNFSMTEGTCRWGDITLDSYVNGSDALSILNYVADIIESYPVADTEDFTEGQFTVGYNAEMIISD